MRTKLLLAIIAVLFAATYASCSDDDGDWPPMRWKTDVKTSDGGFVVVPAEGGTYVFTCTNYSGLWIDYASETTDGKTKNFYEESGNSTINVTWATIKLAEGKLTVTIAPNEAATSRTLCVSTTAGDIFATFKFTQQLSEENYMVDDISWYDDCPYNLYRIYPRSGTEEVELYSGISTELHAVWLEKIIATTDKHFNEATMYSATHALVADSISEDVAHKVPNLRMVDVNTDVISIKDIMTSAELSYMLDEAPIGERMTFGLYLLNAKKKALQKLDVTFVKVKKPE